MSESHITFFGPPLPNSSAFLVFFGGEICQVSRFLTKFQVFWHIQSENLTKDASSFSFFNPIFPKWVRLNQRASTQPPNATFTQLTCADLFYLDTSGNQIDLESTLEELKTIDTSDAKAAAQSAENAALSVNLFF